MFEAFALLVIQANLEESYDDVLQGNGWLTRQ